MTEAQSDFSVPLHTLKAVSVDDHVSFMRAVNPLEKGKAPSKELSLGGGGSVELLRVSDVQALIDSGKIHLRADPTTPYMKALYPQTTEFLKTHGLTAEELH